MPIRQTVVVRALRSAVILPVIALFPATAWLQEQSAVTPTMTQQGTAEQQGVPAAPAQAQPEAPPAAAPAADQPGKYTIRQGDTLWDISNAFYRDPFLWPLIWKSNPSIDNPDLIYPGNVLVIPSLAPVERAMSAPEEAAPVQEKTVEEKAPPAAAPQEEGAALSLFRRRPVPEDTAPKPAAGGGLVMPEEGPLPLFDKYAMLSAGYVNDEDDSKDYVQGSPEDPYKGIHGSNILGYDNEVYIVVKSRETVNIGDRFIIYQPLHSVGSYGRLFKINGVLKVTSAKDKEADVYTARITLSFDAAMKGNMLVPYQEPNLIFPAAQTQAKNISGSILDVTDRRTISGQVDVVYLNKGKEDGVAPGDRFTVYGEPNRETGVTRAIGEVQVLIVKPRTATAVVRKSIDTMTKGYQFVSKN